MNIYEYLDAIYNNTGGSEAVSGVATIASAIKVATFSGVAEIEIDITSYIGNYTDLTEDNFLVEVLSWPSSSGTTNSGEGNCKIYSGEITKSYDNLYGTLTVSGLYCKGTYRSYPATSYMVGNVYIFGSNISLIDDTSVTSETD